MHLTCSMKADIAWQIHHNIRASQNAGTVEPGLCAFLPELAAVAEKLSVTGEANGAALRMAEAQWAEIMIRLRGYAGTRGKVADSVDPNEAKALLKPLLEALPKLRKDACRGDPA